jgi:hypothetical protein
MVELAHHPAMARVWGSIDVEDDHADYRSTAHTRETGRTGAAPSAEAEVNNVAQGDPRRSG